MGNNREDFLPLLCVYCFENRMLAQVINTDLAEMLCVDDPSLADLYVYSAPRGPDTNDLLFQEIAKMSASRDKVLVVIDSAFNESEDGDAVIQKWGSVRDTLLKGKAVNYWYLLPDISHFYHMTHVGDIHSAVLKKDMRAATIH